MARSETPSDEASAHVLDAAERMFLAGGYAGARLHDLASALEMRPASLYHHAPGGKRHLWDRVVHRALVRHRDGLQKAAADADLDLRAQLIAMAQWLLSQPAVNVVSLAASSPGEPGALSEAIYEALMLPVADVLRAAQERGDARTDVVPDLVAERPEHSVEPASRAAWRAWLVANHGSAPHVWLVTQKKAAGGPALSYGEAVEEALCVGWVDSLPRALDAERTMLYFAPRKVGSGWSRPNKERVTRLEAAAQMLPAVQVVVDAARADGSWSTLDDVENLVVPGDLATVLDTRSGARANWDAFPRSARRGILEWIHTAKRAETRARRIAETAEKAARSERANQWRRR